jgi:radical SAM superfamily enzyme YgiQ (UPF0313 family)
MKILLIQPPKAPITIGGEDLFIYEPLALEYVAAGVARDHDVRILDLRLEKKLAQTLDEFRPDTVGITAYTVHVNTARKLFEQIKMWNPGALTVVGGHHATIAPEDFCVPAIDLIVRGEGVFAFQQIVERFARGEHYDGIPGVAFARAGALVQTDYAPVVDLDAIPSPERKLTARYRARYFSEWMKPLASIRTSKGCPYRCSFCALWKLTGGRYLKRAPEKIVEELRGIDEEDVFFADDESLVDAARMKTLAQLIRDAGIRKRYFLYGRSDTIAKNPDLLELWKTIGLERVFIGLEFFRDQDLQAIRKGSTADDNARAVKMAQDLGIEIYATLIVRPDFQRDDFAALRAYCRALNLNFAGFPVLTPLPGTDLHAQVKDRLLTRDYDYTDFIHTILPTALPLGEFYREYYQLAANAIPPARQLAILKKFPLRDLAPALKRSAQWVQRLRTIHLDYANAPRQAQV